MASNLDRVADRFDVVIGVDTHTDTHTAVAVDHVGAVLGEVTVTTDGVGLAALLTFATDHSTPGARRLFAVEGTRSHGQGLCRILTAAGEQVCEAPTPVTATRRRGGKSDTLDAVLAARTILGTPLHALRRPRADGIREALRILLITRRHHSDARTATVNIIKSMILTADDTLRTHLRDLPTSAQITALAAHNSDHDPDTDYDPHTTTENTIRRAELGTLARQITNLDTILATNKTHLTALVTQLCPPLIAQHGVGPVTAAIALTRYSHPGRVRDEAAFAALAGTAPIPVSSGRTDRHRLNRGGDRTLNSALHTIMITRRRAHPATRDYVTRRRAEGLTNTDINRCLKRYITRQLYRIMNNHYQPA